MKRKLLQEIQKIGGLMGVEITEQAVQPAPQPKVDNTKVRIIPYEQQNFMTVKDYRGLDTLQVPKGSKVVTIPEESYNSDDYAKLWQEFRNAKYTPEQIKKISTNLRVYTRPGGAYYFTTPSKETYFLPLSEKNGLWYPAKTYYKRDENLGTYESYSPVKSSRRVIPSSLKGDNVLDLTAIDLYANDGLKQLEDTFFNSIGGMVVEVVLVALTGGIAAIPYTVMYAIFLLNNISLAQQDPNCVGENDAFTKWLMGEPDGQRFDNCFRWIWSAVGLVGSAATVRVLKQGKNVKQLIPFLTKISGFIDGGLQALFNKIPKTLKIGKRMLNIEAAVNVVRERTRALIHDLTLFGGVIYGSENILKGVLGLRNLIAKRGIANVALAINQPVPTVQEISNISEELKNITPEQVKELPKEKQEALIKPLTKKVKEIVQQNVNILAQSDLDAVTVFTRATRTLSCVNKNLIQNNITWLDQAYDITGVEYQHLLKVNNIGVFTTEVSQYKRNDGQAEFVIAEGYENGDDAELALYKNPFESVESSFVILTCG